MGQKNKLKHLKPKAEQPPADAAPSTKKGFLCSLLPEGGVLPWWVVLLASVYLLLHLGLLFEGPCGILGVSSPLRKLQVDKAFRAISTCTHPDKLIRHTPADKRRGELLFKRATDARDELLAQLLLQGEGKESVSCDTKLNEAIYQARARAICRCGGSLEHVRVGWRELVMKVFRCGLNRPAGWWQGIMFMGGWVVETGATTIVASIFNFLWDLGTFSYDLSTTISCTLLLVTLFRTLQSLVLYVRRIHFRRSFTDPPTFSNPSALRTLQLCLLFMPDYNWHPLPPPSI